MIENFTSYSYYNDLIISLFHDLIISLFRDEMISYVNEEDVNVEIDFFSFNPKRFYILIEIIFY